MFYTITLNPAIDYIQTIPRFDLNQTIRTIIKTASDFHSSKQDQILGNYQLGGKGINAGICAANHDLAVKILFPSALAWRGLIYYLLEQTNLQNEDLVIFDAFTTMRLNTKIMINGIMTEINDHNYLHSQKIFREILDYLNIHLQPGDYVSLNGSFPKYVNLDQTNEVIDFGLTQAEIEKNFSRQLSQLVQAKKAHLIFDTSKTATLAGLKYNPFLIKPNRDELCAFFDQPVTDDLAVLKSFGEKLLEMGSQHVLISLGGQGAILLTASGSYYASTLKNFATKKIVSLQGCGDSMVGAFISYFEHQKQKKLVLEPEQLLFYTLAAGTAKAYQTTIPNSLEIATVFKHYANRANYDCEIQKK